MGLQIRDIADKPLPHWVPCCKPLKLGLNSLASCLCPKSHSPGPGTRERLQLISVPGLGTHCLSCFMLPLQLALSLPSWR